MQYKYNIIYCCLLSFFILVAGLAMIFFFLSPSHSGSLSLSDSISFIVLSPALPGCLGSTLCLRGVGLLLLLLSSTLLSCTIMNIETPPPSVKHGLSPDVSSNEYLFQGRMFALCTQHEQAGGPFIRYSRSSDSVPTQKIRANQIRTSQPETRR